MCARWIMNKIRVVLLVGMISYFNAEVRASNYNKETNMPEAMSIFSRGNKLERKIKEPKIESFGGESKKNKIGEISEEELKNLTSLVKSESRNDSAFSWYLNKARDFCKGQAKNIPKYINYLAYSYRMYQWYCQLYQWYYQGDNYSSYGL